MATIDDLLAEYDKKSAPAQTSAKGGKSDDIDAILAKYPGNGTASAVTPTSPDTPIPQKTWNGKTPEQTAEFIKQMRKNIKDNDRARKFAPLITGLQVAGTTLELPKNAIAGIAQYIKDTVSPDEKKKALGAYQTLKQSLIEGKGLGDVFGDIQHTSGSGALGEAVDTGIAAASTALDIAGDPLMWTPAQWRKGFGLLAEKATIAGEGGRVLGKLAERPSTVEGVMGTLGRATEATSEIGFAQGAKQATKTMAEMAAPAGGKVAQGVQTAGQAIEAGAKQTAESTAKQATESTASKFTNPVEGVSPVIKPEDVKKAITEARGVTEPVATGEMPKTHYGKDFVDEKRAYNISKTQMNLSPEADALLNKTVINDSDHLLSASKPVTNKQMTNMSALGDYDPAQLGSGSARDRQVMAKRGEDRLGFISEEAVRQSKLGNDISALTGQQTQLMRDLSLYYNEAGRSLQAKRAALNNLSSAARVRNDVLAAVDKTQAGIDAMNEAGKNVNWENFNDVADYYRKFVKPTGLQVDRAVRYANMLSSPLTANAIAITDAVQTVFPAITKVTKAAWDVASVTAQRALGKQASREYFFREIPEYLKGAFSPSNMSDAWHNMLKALNGQALPDAIGVESYEDLLMRMPLFSPKTAVGKVEKAYTTPMRVHNAIYHYFQTLIQGGETSAATLAKELGATRRFAGEFGNITPEAIGKAKSLQLTFRQQLNPYGQGALHQTVDKLANLVYKARHIPVINHIIPFVQIPTNMFKEGLTWTPAGLINLFGEGVEKEEVLSRALVGTAVMGSIMHLVKYGGITGDEAFNSPRPSNSVMLNGKWVNYDKLGALAYPFHLAGAIQHELNLLQSQDKITPEEYVAAYSRAVQGFGVFLSNQTYMQGMSGTMDAMKGKGIAKLESNIVSQYIPYKAMASWANNMTNKYVRDPKGFWEKLKAAMPILSATVQPRMNADEEYKQTEEPLIRAMNAVFPFRVTTPDKQAEEDYDDVRREALQLRQEKAQEDEQSRREYKPIN